MPQSTKTQVISTRLTIEQLAKIYDSLFHLGEQPENLSSLLRLATGYFCQLANPTTFNQVATSQSVEKITSMLKPKTTNQWPLKSNQLSSCISISQERLRELQRASRTLSPDKQEKVVRLLTYLLQGHTTEQEVLSSNDNEAKNLLQSILNAIPASQCSQDEHSSDVKVPSL